MTQGATRLRIYEPTMVPGLLQTGDWARTILITKPGLPEDDQPDDTQAGVASRLECQQILTAGTCGIHI